jgi:hypothetical protein
MLPEPAQNIFLKVNATQDLDLLKMDKLKHLINHLHQQVLALLNKHKELTVESNTIIYTEDQLMARLKFFIGICLALTLTGIVFVVLYSIIFITQPLNAISPIDQKFFEMIIPIATFLTGTLSGIMLAGGSKEEMEMKRDMIKQAQENSNTYAKANPVKIEPTFNPGFSTTQGFNGTSAPSTNIIYINGKPAPQQAPHPEI